MRKPDIFKKSRVLFNKGILYEAFQVSTSKEDNSSRLCFVRHKYDYVVTFCATESIDFLAIAFPHFHKVQGFYNQK